MLHLSRFTRVLLVVLIFTSGSCEGGPGRGEEDEQAAFDPEELPRRHLVERFQLGGPDAPEAEAFARVPPLAVARDGSLFALSRSAGEVRRFSNAGEFLGTIGRRGEGPGEFGNPVRLGRVGDTLWVRDLRPPRLSYFTSEGHPLETVGLESATTGSGGLPAGPEAVLRNGTWITIGPMPPDAPRGPATVPLLMVRSDGARHDTLGSTVQPETLHVPGVGFFRGIRPFPRAPQYDAVPGGEGVVVASWGGQGKPGLLSVAVHRWDGSTTLERTIDLPPIELAKSVADSIVAASADSVRSALARARELGVFRGVELPGDLREVVREQLELEDHLPPIQGLLAGLDGSIWLQRVVGPGASEWIALDPDGTPVFRVDLPRGQVLRAASLESIWTTRTGALDVPYVARYDVVSQVTSHSHGSQPDR